MRGKLIAFCGIDGCGKTTQANLLMESIKQNGNDKVKIIHGFKPNTYSMELKEIVKKSGLDYNLDVSNSLRAITFVADLINNCAIIEEFLEKGYTVICEKYILDTVVYSPIMGADKTLIEALRKSVVKADYNILLDVEPHMSIERVIKRSISDGKDIAPKESIEIAIEAAMRFKKEVLKENNALIVDGQLDRHAILNKIWNHVMGN